MTIGVLCEDPVIAGRCGAVDGVDEIYCAGAVTEGKARWIQTFPYILRSAADPRPLKKTSSGLPEIDPAASGVLIRGLDGLEYLLESGYKGEIIADATLYSMNSRSVRCLLENGISRLTAPYEIDRHSLMSRGGADKTCLVVYGRIPLMVSAQCVFLNSGSGCAVRNGEKSGNVMMIKDRKGAYLPVKRFCGECLNVIYNSVPLSLHKDIKDVLSFAPSSLRLDITTETEEEALKIVKYYVNLVRGSSTGKKEEKPPFSAYTRGHFSKGML
ncbi:MAG: hypothetical protein K5985_05045 [Lachnospiraceae bacterium]|nr:hypothetical protein [Lachnospiraceae bacterium]